LKLISKLSTKFFPLVLSNRISLNSTQTTMKTTWKEICPCNALGPPLKVSWSSANRINSTVDFISNLEANW